MPDNEWNPAERALLRRLSTPAKTQAFLDTLAYNREVGGQTCRSPRRVLRDQIAHCFEGALLAAAALSFHGFPALILDLEAVRDVDHILAVYRLDGHWGAIAKSNYASLRFREPVYRTVRELVMSYFEHYHNRRGEKTLRGYSRPVRLDRFPGWRVAEDDVWQIPEYLCTIRHAPVLTSAMASGLNRLDRRLRQAEQTGMIFK
jgi:hypothetical protein